MKKQTQIGLLVAALIGGAIAATVSRSTPRASPPRHLSAAKSDSVLPDGPESPASEQAATVEGNVSDVIQVPHYTYVHVDISAGRSSWAAVNSAPSIKRGDSIRIVQAQLMQNFHSASLNRDFESIYFGVLQGAESSDDEPGARGMTNPHGAASDSSASSLLNPHVRARADGEAIKLGTVAKAKGEHGYTIAEIYAKKAALAEQVVRVRGIVVKSTPDVMGKTFVHVRDGSGRETSQDMDLTVTTQAQPQLHQNLVFEGRLQLNVDLGAGYSYPLILRDAQVVDE